MAITLFEPDYVDNKAITFSLLVKVYKTMFWTYEVVKKMFLTQQNFTMSGNFCCEQNLAVFKGLGLKFGSTYELVPYIKSGQFSMIYQLVQISLISEFIFLIKSLLKKCHLMLTSKIVKRYQLCIDDSINLYVQLR